MQSSPRPARETNHPENSMYESEMDLTKMTTLSMDDLSVTDYGSTAGTDTTQDSEADEFCRFLLLNPYVIDGGLWTDYYSKDLMMGPEAKQQMVLPDKKPLPNIVERDEVRSSKVGKQ